MPLCAFLFYNLGALIYKGFFFFLVEGLKRQLNSPKGWAAYIYIYIYILGGCLGQLLFFRDQFIILKSNIF